MTSNWEGMNSTTGKACEDEAHLRQSIADILMTPLGSRVMRREYGSAIPSLIDEPDNDVTRLRLISAAVIALWRWEPRITPSSVSFARSEQGALTMAITSQRSDTLRAVTTDITLTGGV
ncbi:baseplate assembly protein [Rouxiella silvae]|uniref:Baseplate assembly protein n=1 Tax=Rouxiella silvae TaxID=1646373 RepID=A0ABX3U266_9GAMM|nr:GPW/gp25 family protein [Rouxiella silvae]ORJ21588.1 baseplate assembly protein [Rouxiella silvae]